MSKKMWRACVAVLGLTVVPLLAISEQKPLKSLALAGYQGTVPLKLIDGRNYVDVESLARLTNGTLSFHGDQIELKLPAGAGAAAETTSTATTTPPVTEAPLPSAAPAPPPPATPPPNKGFSRDFLRAAIEEMSTLREWHGALASAIQAQMPITQTYLGPAETAAQTGLQLMQVAATTESDHQAAELIQSGYQKMQQLNDKYIGLAASQYYISTYALDDDSLNESVVACGNSLEAMIASGHFSDDGSCD